MATLQSWRKTVGTLKDTTAVRLANLNSDFKDLDVAIVKATNHFSPPKERHIRSNPEAFDPTTDSVSIQDGTFDPTGWELALVTAPSSNGPTVLESKMAGGFDKLIAYRNQQQQQQVYEAPSPNPFMAANPSAMSPAVQMASMAQQQLAANVLHVHATELHGMVASVGHQVRSELSM